jgi:hypothetical protein
VLKLVLPKGSLERATLALFEAALCALEMAGLLEAIDKD